MPPRGVALAEAKTLRATGPSLLLALVLAAGPALAGPGGHMVERRCENQYASTSLGDAGSAVCVMPAVDYHRGTHATLSILQTMGADVRNVTVEARPATAGFPGGYDPAAAPVFRCIHGYDHGATLSCPTTLPPEVLPYGKYVFVQTLGVAKTPVQPTVAGRTIDTGQHASAARFGFTLFYN